MSQLPGLLKWFCFLICGVALSFITQHAPTPEKSKNLIYSLPAFLVFVLFLSSIFSWGAFLRTKIKLPFFSDLEDGLFDLTFGSILFYLFAYALTTVGLFASSHYFILWFLLSCGFALGSKEIKPSRWFYFGEHWLNKILVTVPLLLVALKLIEGFQFHQHGDPYITYLPAPRSWAALGNFSQYLQYTEFFLSTSFESLFAWGTALMGLEGGRGLDLSQWFSQWVTAGVGVFGLVFAVGAIARRLTVYFKTSTLWHPVVMISAIQIPVIQWTANLAKNDMGVSFWGVSAFYFCVFHSTSGIILSLLSGALVGTMVVGKLTLVLFGAILSLYFILTKKPNSSRLLFIFGGLVGCAPIFLRNYFLTKNPVFPWLPTLFPNSLVGTTATEGAKHATTLLFKFSNFPFYLQELLKQIPLILTLVIFLILVFKKSKERSQFLRFILIPCAAFAAFTLTLRPSTEIRYQGPVLVLLAGLSAYFSFNLLENLKFSKRIGPFALAVFILATSNITFFTFTQIGGQKFSVWSKRIITFSDSGGIGKLWIRNNLTPADQVLVVGDGYVYYTIDYQFTQYSKIAEYEQYISGKNVTGALQAFKQAKFDYLYLANDADYFPYRATISAIMLQAANPENDWNLKCLRYQVPSTQVWDLNCLKTN